jgi:hypothetical protein
MEVNLNIFENGRRPQFCLKKEDDLNIYLKMGYDLIKNNATKTIKSININIFENGRQPQFS